MILTKAPSRSRQISPQVFGIPNDRPIDRVALGDRKRDGNRGSRSWLARDLRRAPVQMDDRADKTQAKPKPSLAAAPVAPKEPVPNPREILGGNAAAGVGELDDDRLSRILRGDVDTPLRGRVFDRIIE